MFKQQRRDCCWVKAQTGGEEGRRRDPWDKSGGLISGINQGDEGRGGPQAAGSRADQRQSDPAQFKPTVP